MPNRHLPASVEAERSILGAILLDNRTLNEAAGRLQRDEFSLDSHRRIYSRMLKLAESAQPIDLTMLIEELDRHKELQTVGDVGYVSGLLDGVPDRPSIEHYINIVKDKALLRNLICQAEGPIKAAYEGHATGEQVLTGSETAIRGLADSMPWGRRRVVFALGNKFRR